MFFVLVRRWLRDYRRVTTSTRDREAIADLDVGASGRTGSHFDRGKRAPRASDAARPHMRSEVDHAPVAIGEDDVDGKTHAEGVDGLTRRDDQGGAVVEAVASEQAATTGR